MKQLKPRLSQLLPLSLLLLHLPLPLVNNLPLLIPTCQAKRPRRCNSHRLGLLSSPPPCRSDLLLKRRAGAGLNRRKTDGTDGSELRNTLKGKEHGKGAEVLNKVREKGEHGAYNVGVKDLASAYVLCPRLAERGGLSIYGRTKIY